MSESPRPPITRDDLEARLRSLQGDVMDRVTDKRQTLMTIASVAGVVVIVVVFLLGRRSGRRRRTVVEVRRF